MIGSPRSARATRTLSRAATNPIPIKAALKLLDRGNGELRLHQSLDQLLLPDTVQAVLAARLAAG